MPHVYLTNRHPHSEKEAQTMQEHHFFRLSTLLPLPSHNLQALHH